MSHGTSFSSIYQKMSPLPFDVSKTKNLEILLNVASDESFKKIIAKLEAAAKSCTQSLECRIQELEVTRLNKRWALGKKLVAANIKTVDELENSGFWNEFYEHIVFEWTNSPTFNASENIAYQYKEIARIKKQLSVLTITDKKYFSSSEEVYLFLENLKGKIQTAIVPLFGDLLYPDFKIALNVDPQLQHVPAYYDPPSKTVYYTFAPKKVFHGDLEFLFLHEAIPGHHLQLSFVQNSLAQKVLGPEFLYYDFLEGWAAYVEIYGKDLNIYDSEEAQRQALLFDLLRSIRVIVDLNMHSKIWSQEQAKKFWIDTAPELTDVADREITRMLNWPGQAISYEYGKMEIIKAMNYAIKNGMTIKDFHTWILGYGQLPTYVILEQLKTDLTKKNTKVHH
jgi:hypothetical protein